MLQVARDGPLTLTRTVEMNVGVLPDGTKGFDANQQLTAKAAVLFFKLKHRFAIRYVPRVKWHDGDATKDELQRILASGLAVGLVQHVAKPGWVATEQLGRDYGKFAADQAAGMGYPLSANLWCDAESVAHPNSDANQMADFANAWWTEVSLVGFIPGMYVGYQSGLTALGWSTQTRYTSFWSSYNLDSDKIPANRGVQMRQMVAHPQDMPPGWTRQTMDCDIVHADAVGGTPMWMLP